MINQEFDFLLEKLIANDIDEDEMQRLEELCELDPENERKLEDHKLAIMAIKSQAIRDELSEIMESSEVLSKKKTVWRWAAILLLIAAFSIIFWPFQSSVDQIFADNYEVYPNLLVTRNSQSDEIMDAYIAYNQGNYPQAIQLMERSSQYVEDKNPTVIFFLGQSYLAAGQYSKAKDLFETIPADSQYYNPGQWYTGLTFLKIDASIAKGIFQKIASSESNLYREKAISILRQL